jgi:hypothetical protein
MENKKIDEIIKEKIDSIMEQLAQNWCLVRYGRLSSQNIQTLNHWKTELKASMLYMAAKNVTNDNSDKKRQKILETVWDENDFSTDMNAVDLTVTAKFENENLDQTIPEYQQTLKDFMNAKNEIISAIIAKSKDTIVEYVSNL